MTGALFAAPVSGVAACGAGPRCAPRRKGARRRAGSADCARGLARSSRGSAGARRRRALLTARREVSARRGRCRAAERTRLMSPGLSALGLLFGGRCRFGAPRPVLRRGCRSPAVAAWVCRRTLLRCRLRPVGRRDRLGRRPRAARTAAAGARLAAAWRAPRAQGPPAIGAIVGVGRRLDHRSRVDRRRHSNRNDDRRLGRPACFGGTAVFRRRPSARDRWPPASTGFFGGGQDCLGILRRLVGDRCRLRRRSARVGARTVGAQRQFREARRLGGWPFLACRVAGASAGFAGCACRVRHRARSARGCGPRGGRRRAGRRAPRRPRRGASVGRRRASRRTRRAAAARPRGRRPARGARAAIRSGPTQQAARQHLNRRTKARRGLQAPGQPFPAINCEDQIN